ncbi:hypothetical protein ACRALDRAFT_1063876 [Sodiomyces alcalophilus JCM 7366]|uniref:uncharacterized protein n=1 Tax=Sodiomyces alcalophilus JCM 7366 TaxID=591952 RepID=UPI0039B411AB
MVDPPANKNAKGKEKQSGTTVDSESPHGRYSREQDHDYRDDSSSFTSRVQASISTLLHTEALTRGQAAPAESSSSNKMTDVSSPLSTLDKGETSLVRSGGSRGNEAAFSETLPIGSTAGLRQYDRFLGLQGEVPCVHPSAANSTTATMTQNANHSGTQKPSVGSEFARQMARDGAQVTELLALPDPEDTGGDCDIYATAVPPHELSELKRALFGSDPMESTGRTRITPDWDSLLNFQPDFLMQSRSDGIYQHLGVRTEEEASELWLDKWKIVLASYNSEVWGALDPLAQEALEELRKTGNTRPGIIALGRLRQILGHIRNSK